MRALVAYFSRTGNTQTVAEEIARSLSPRYEVDTCRIVPQRPRGYISWLLMSFIPSSKINIQQAIDDAFPYDLIVLGSPKWTLSCPPFNRYLSQLAGCEGKSAAIFITYGGFGEKRYLNGLIKKVEAKGAMVDTTLLIRRRWIENGEHLEKIRTFCGRLAAVAAGTNQRRRRSR